jgi:hypothetical protein
MSNSAKNQNAVFALFQVGAVLTLREIEDQTGISHHETIKTAGYLLNRGFVSRLENGVFELTRCGREAKADQVVIKSGPMGPDTGKSRKPFKGTLRQSAWVAMRIMTTFSVKDLVLVSSDDPSDEQHASLRRYCAGLVKAEFLMEMPNREAGSAETSNGFKRYRLMNDTGEIAPTYRNTKCEVYDHNTGKVSPCHG